MQRAGLSLSRQLVRTVHNQGTVLRLNLLISQGAMPNLRSMTIIGPGF